MTNIVIWDTSGNTWFKSDKIDDKKNKKEIKKKEPICIHLIFEEMSKISTDPFWKNLFLDIAKNNPKRGFSYSPNLHPDSCNVGKLVYKSQGKEYFCEVNNNPNISIINVKNFMTEKANIMSDHDKKIKNIELNNELLNKRKIEINNWNGVKNEKKTIIINFTEKMAKKYSLNQEEKNNLINVINEGIAGGILDNDNIIVLNNEIVEIIGLNNINNNFFLDPIIKKVYPIKLSKISKDDSENLDELEYEYEYEYKNKNIVISFEKFLNVLNKKYCNL